MKEESIRSHLVEMDTPQQLSLELSMPQVPTLANFVVGENAEAMASIQAFCSGTGPQFLYLWGVHGCGCSHLLRAIAPEQKERIPLFDETVQIYAVDDAQALLGFEQEELFHLMNEVRSHPGSRIVVAGHAPIPELPLRQDIKSRLSWGLTFEIHHLDADSATEEFIRQASERGIVLNHETRLWIETHCPRDIQSLRRLLDELDAYAIKEKRKVTLPLILQFIAKGIEK